LVQSTLTGSKTTGKKRPKPAGDDEDDDGNFSSTPPTSKKAKKAPAKKAKATGKALAEIENDSMQIDDAASGTADGDAAPAATTGKKKTATETYQKLTQLEHIIRRPDTYIGSVEKTDQKMWVFNKNEKMMENRTITYVPGLYKIFDEILVNAADNSQRDSSMTYIKVTIDRESGEISVENNGKGIPVEIHEKEQVWIPELIFGHLLTGSNYDDNEKKTVGGRNGYGAKLTNIFSKRFTIELQDSVNGKRYKQTWTDNMGNMEKAKITSNKSSDFVKVSFLPDYKRFGMENGIDDDLEALLYRRVYDMAGTVNGVKVYLNGEQLKINFKSYCELYARAIARERGDEATDGDKPPAAKVEFDQVRDKGRLWQIGFTVSDGTFQQVSFVNNIATTSGGTHVNYIADQICDALVKELNKRKKGHSLKPSHFRNHIFIFINCLIDNPAFTSQTKEQLTTKVSAFGSKCQLSEPFLKKIRQSEAIANIMAFADKKADKMLAKSDGNKRSRISNEKLVDANLAGTKRGHECTLILTEGDSARGLAVAGRAVLDPDRIGVFPLRGKMLNVRDASIDQIMKNKEIENIKKFLGLKHKQEYTDTKSLRYGHLMIMADQDLDGSHIKGLLINFLEVQFPSLLRIPGFFQEFITPVVKVWQGNNPKKPQNLKMFFNLPEYEQWKEEHKHELRKWKYKYLKGLGSSSNEDAQVYFKDLDRHLKRFEVMTDEESKMLELVFSKKKADARKEWLANFVPGTYLDSTTHTVKYKDFIDKELILFSMADNVRSIPSVVDGLKPGQRKVVYGAFKRNLVNDQKVAEFAGYISEVAAYHHGEQSLQQTIVGLAQNYVGSNNVNILEPSGNFGSRLAGGSDAASARYIHTRLSPFARKVFSKLDEPNLEYQFDDGNMIEPKVYVPIIPMVLVNGADGIGTGWSTGIPNYNPKDIVDNLKRRMGRDESGDGVEKPFLPMTPWWRGWKGQVLPDGPNRWKFNGIIKQDETNPNEVHVTELPIRMWTDDFKARLEEILRAEKTPSFIKDYKEFNDHRTVHFVIEMEPKHMEAALKEGLIEKFKLSKIISATNLVAFDTQGKIKKYENPEEMLEEYYHYRLAMYTERKKHWLSVYDAEYRKLKNQYRFILEIIEGKLVINRKQKKILVKELRDRDYEPFPPNADKKVKNTDEELNRDEASSDDEDAGGGVTARDYDYLLSMPVWSFTAERLEKLKGMIAAKKAEWNELNAKSEKDLWVEDLDAFMEEWEAQLKQDEENYHNVTKKGRRQSLKLGLGNAKGGRRRAGDDDDDDYNPAAKKAKTAKATAATKVKQEKEVKEEKIEPKKTQERFAEKFAAKSVKVKDDLSDEDFALLQGGDNKVAVKKEPGTKSRFELSDSDDDFMDLGKPSAATAKKTAVKEEVDGDDGVVEVSRPRRAAAKKAKYTASSEEEEEEEEEEDDEDDSMEDFIVDDDEEEDVEEKPAAAAKKSLVSRKKVPSEEDDDEDFDMELSEKEKPKPAAKKPTASKDKAKAEEDHDDLSVEEIPAPPKKTASSRTKDSDASAESDKPSKSSKTRKDEDSDVIMEDAKPSRRAAAKAKARYVESSDSESDSDNDMDLGDVGSLVKGIGGGSSAAASNRLSLFSMSRPEDGSLSAKRLKPARKESKSSNFAEDDEHDDTNYEALAMSSPRKGPTTAAAGKKPADALDDFLSDDDLPSAATKPSASSSTGAASKAKPLAVVPTQPKKRGRPLGSKNKPKDDPSSTTTKAGAKPKLKQTTLSPAAKAYAAKKAKASIDDDESGEDEFVDAPASPPPAAAKTRPGRAAAQKAKTTIVIDDDEEDDSILAGPSKKGPGRKRRESDDVFGLSSSEDSE